MDVTTLPKDVQEYISTIEQSWQERYSALEEQYKLLLIQKFCRKSEKSDTDQSQQLLFNEEEHIAAVEEQNETIHSYSRKKRGRKPIDDSLPREDVIIDIPEEDKHCACGHDLVRIGEETSERLQVILPKMWVERIIRIKYACKHCEGSGDEDKPAVRIADPPASIIPKSIVTPGLLAFIITNKFIDHLPYYRQEKRFERIGIHISRQNMSNWQQAAYEKISPLIELIKEHIRSGPVINMDETPVQVLNEPDRKNMQKSYMWLMRGGPSEKPALLYSYRETRGSKHITELLEGFEGYLQTDGYEAYETALKSNDKVIHVGCMAHARRKFDEAAKVSKKPGSAQEALKFIRRLYQIEAELRVQNLDADEFLKMRKEKAQSTLNDFKAWLEKRAMQVPPSLLLGKAISYTLNEWSELIRYLDSPYLTPDNNASENAIRPFVLGRKNWLFSGSPSGAESSCAMYSLIETAKQNGRNPNDYLLSVFEKAPLVKSSEEWKNLLPWNMKNA